MTFAPIYTMGSMDYHSFLISGEFSVFVSQVVEQQ